MTMLRTSENLLKDERVQQSKKWGTITHICGSSFATRPL